MISNKSSFLVYELFKKFIGKWLIRSSTAQTNQLYHESIGDKCTLDLPSCLIERNDKTQFIEPFVRSNLLK